MLGASFKAQGALRCSGCPAMLRALHRGILQCSGHPEMLETLHQGILKCSKPCTGASCDACGILQCSKPCTRAFSNSRSILQCLKPRTGAPCKSLPRQEERGDGPSFAPGSSLSRQGIVFGVPGLTQKRVSRYTELCRGSACGAAGARCFPDVAHFLAGSSALGFLCTCLFWTTNKIKSVFITPFPGGREFRM